MACLKTLPNELLHKTIDYLMNEGLHGSAVSLARTDRSLESRVLPRIYRSVVENETFFLAHWAAEHGHVTTLKRAIEAGADINEPLTSCIPAYPVCETSEFGEKRYCRRMRTADLDGKELHQAIQQRCRLMQERILVREDWYIRKKEDYEEIKSAEMWRLFKYYKALDEEGNCNGPIDQFADAVETKRRFLDAFIFWVTPLHIAIREGSDGIFEALMRNKKIDLNSTMYGNCGCIKYLDWLPGVQAFSPLHQAICETTGFYIPQLIRLGTSYLSLSWHMLDATVDTLPVRPVLANPQPYNLLHEILSADLPDLWTVNPWRRWCAEKYCRGDPREWILSWLLDNGYENRLNERDVNQKLAVEIACATDHDRAIITTLLERGISQYDSLLRVEVKFRNTNDTGSILTWAISNQDFHLAEYLLTHEIMQPLFDISAPSARLGHTALHVLCTNPWWFGEDVSGVLRNQILHKILTKTEVDTVSSGHTPLTYALKWLVDSPEPDEPPLQLVGTLLWHGADILNGSQENSQTPLEIFLEQIAKSETRSRILRGETGLYYNQDKDSLLLQAIRQIRLDKHITVRTDTIDCIVQMLRNPVDLTWVPQALEQLRRIRSASCDNQRVGTDSLVSPDDV